MRQGIELATTRCRSSCIEAWALGKGRDQLTHGALYALIVAIPLTGIADTLARGRSIDFGRRLPAPRRTGCRAAAPRGSGADDAGHAGGGAEQPDQRRAEARQRTAQAAPAGSPHQRGALAAGDHRAAYRPRGAAGARDVARGSTLSPATSRAKGVQPHRLPDRSCGGYTTVPEKACGNALYDWLSHRARLPTGITIKMEFIILLVVLEDNMRRHFGWALATIVSLTGVGAASAADMAVKARAPIPVPV